jgi:hypothetical protein
MPRSEGVTGEEGGLVDFAGFTAAGFGETGPEGGLEFAAALQGFPELGSLEAFGRQVGHWGADAGEGVLEVGIVGRVEGEDFDGATGGFMGEDFVDDEGLGEAGIPLHDVGDLEGGRVHAGARAGLR